ncbi:hypothetical protein [Ottowia cancrivicina]|uniref:Uncharacterized protein n=1 Tax=Ottowia cancrivicina TaxID=3040346 RepID=A0AAW6RIS4_9BURK|nr:hypothetical protein [Ottowia sp. 10c7w1]MDG9698404.1 hypothetical protein [Ottowia sp. 10c7w1]
MGVSVPSYSCMAYMPASKWGEATERESQSIKPMEGDADRSAKVDGAVEKIRDKMHSSFFNPVTNQDLRDVQSTIAGLPNEDASAVVCELSESELRRMADQVNDSFLFGGLGGEEKQAFFDTLAQKLDGEQLARMTNAFERNSLASTEDVNALGRSIAKHASDDVKLECIKALQGRNELSDQSSVIGFDFGFFLSVSVTKKMSDPQAQVAAQVIASMGDAMAEQTLGLLRSKNLDAVIKGSADPTFSTDTILLPIKKYEAVSFQKLMQTVAKTKNADLKARIFDSAASVLKDAESKNFLVSRRVDAAAMRKGMYDILMSDVNGVITELARNKKTLSGTAMAIYAKSAINAKEYERLGDIQVRLALGNDLKGDHVKLFNSPDQDYMHARNSGYFAGAIGAAVTSISSDVNKQAEIVNALISSAATAVGAVLPPVGSAVAGVGATASGLVVKAVYDQVVSNKSDAVTKLQEASLPFASKRVLQNEEHDLELAAKSPAFSQFEDTWSWTKEHAKP